MYILRNVSDSENGKRTFHDLDFLSSKINVNFLKPVLIN